MGRKRLWPITQHHCHIFQEITYESHQQKIQIKLSHIAKFFRTPLDKISDSEVFNPFLTLKQKELPSST